MDYVCPGCVPSVVMGRQLDKKGMPQALPDSLVEKLNESGIRKLAVGHTPHGNAPTLLRASNMLLVMADTSYSDMSAPDGRGAAISEVRFQADCSVRVHGELEDQREISFSFPSQQNEHIGATLPAFAKLDEGNEEAASGGGSAEELELALLKVLHGKPHFVKAWLPKEQVYLLCNHDGFVVSYTTLGPAELGWLTMRSQQDGGERPMLKGVTSESPQLKQALWLLHEESGSETSPLRNSSMESNATVTSLGDTDIVGLIEAASYAQQLFQQQVQALLTYQEASGEDSKRVAKQIRRMRKSLEKMRKKTSTSSKGVMSSNHDEPWTPFRVLRILSGKFSYPSNRSSSFMKSVSTPDV